METVAIALGVGAFGGLAGAALGPFLGHIFNGWERRAVRRERRQERLRSMIERRLGDWRHYNAAVFTIKASLGAPFNMTGTAAFQEFMSKEAVGFPRGGQVWEPYRIADGTLKADAETMNAGLNELFNLLSKVTNASSIDDWYAECSEKASELEGLKKKMQLRMDELDW